MSITIESLQEQLQSLKKKFKEIEKANKILNQRLAEVDYLYSITSTLSATLDIEEILKFVKKIFTQTFKMDRFSLMLFEENSSLWSIKNHHGLPLVWTKSNIFTQPNNIFLQTMKQKRYIYVKNTSEKNKNLIFHPGLEKQPGSFLCIPILNENDTVLGVLNLFRKEIDAFASYEIELFNKITAQITLALDKTLLYEHTKELSTTDELTGIFNRRYFNQRYEREIQRSKRYNHHLAVVMLDIDHFKIYNDLNGHIMGDEVLKKVAEILDKNIRKADILARYGGEEFVILLPEISKNQAQKVAEKLRKKIEKAEFENEEAQPSGQITISLGLAVYPEDSKNAQKLIEYADNALYLAKSFGRNCVAWHGMKVSLSSNKQNTDLAEKSL